MELNNYQIAAKERARKALKEDPDHYKKLGSKGGKARVKKGFALLKLSSPQRFQDAMNKSLETRRRNKAK